MAVMRAIYGDGAAAEVAAFYDYGKWKGNSVWEKEN